jgi:protein-S-isoprenylcysteine O-methyltransferase Ste14
MLHSILASRTLKNYLFKRYPVMAVWYRMLYNIFALATLGAWLWGVSRLLPNPWEIWYAWPNSWHWLGYGLHFLGLYGAFYTFRPLDTLSFLGIRQILDYYRSNIVPSSLDESSATLTRDGLYRCIRHPLYSSALLILWGAPTVTYWWGIMALLFSAYFVIGSYFEEQRLMRQFEGYKQYRHETGRFLPPLRCIKKGLAKNH